MHLRRGFTLVELLVVIAIIAVLLAVLLGSLRNIKGASQRLTCQSQLKDTGTCVSNYATQYDGRMPRMMYDNQLNFSADGRYTHAHYIYGQLDTSVTPNIVYYGGPGAIWKAGLVPDGRQFYCKAVQGWLDEFKRMCDPTPWGTLPQTANNNTYQCIYAYKGYLYWPQSREMMSKVEFDSLTGVLQNIRYKKGNPTSPYRHADLSPSRAMMVDWGPHTVRGSSYSVNALFGDGHVILNPLPKDVTTGKYIQCYQASYAGSVGWIKDLDPPYNTCGSTGGPWWTAETAISDYMLKFQP